MNDIDYYLGKGYDLEFAKYFANGKRKLVNVRANEDFTLTLLFDNGEKKIYGMKQFIEKNTVFKQLSNFQLFKLVYIDENGNIAWDKDPNVNSLEHWENKIDISSDTCYVKSTLEK